MAVLQVKNERIDFMKNSRRILTVLTVTLLLFAALSVMAMAAPSDVEKHWSKTYVEYGIKEGYINGYPDGTFKPDKTVTRAEFSKMINTAVGIKTTKAGAFSDVKTTDWFYGEVGKALYAGYISGYTDGTFKPNNTISRQEAAVILYRITLPTEKTFDINTFADASDIDTWALDGVKAMAAKKYISGDDNGNFLPTKGLTRAQAAKLIYEFVENENIYSGDVTVRATSTVYSETLFTGNVFVDETIENAEIVFENCRILGTLEFAGKNNKLSATLSVISYIVCNGEESSQINLGTNGTAKAVFANSPAKISAGRIDVVNLDGEDLVSGILEINGDVGTINVNKDAVIKIKGAADHIVVTEKATLLIQGGDIEKLTVEKNAAGSAITLSQDVTIENVVANAKAAFTGSGKIKQAQNMVQGVTYQTAPDKIIGEQGSDPEQDGDVTYMDQPTVSPVNAKTGVSMSTSITLSFASQIYDRDGNHISQSYLEENVTLRKTTASGTKVNAQVSLLNTKTIIISPASPLSAGTKYYVQVSQGVFKDNKGNVNPKISSYFTTFEDDNISSSDITFFPEKAETDVEPDTKIKITFPKAVYRTSGSTLTSAYIASNVIELRKGSATGSKVPFDASISSNRVITITPNDNLEANTKYYVIVLSGMIADKDGNTVSKSTSYFTTSGTYFPVITPANAQTGVSANTQITIDFPTPVTKSTGGNVTASYLMGAVIEIRKSTLTGTPVDFTAAISSDKKTVTITPDEQLLKSTKYYVIINDSTLKDSKGILNDKFTSYFTTASTMAPIITPSNAQGSVPTNTHITVAFDETLYTSSSSSKKLISEDFVIEKEFVTLRRNSTSGTVVKCETIVDAEAGLITLIPNDELIPGLKYYIVVKNKCVYNATGKSNSAQTAYFTTANILVPSFDPYDMQEDVDVDTKIEISFDEPVYTLKGETITMSYVANNVVELHKNDEDGNFESLVPFSVTLSSDKQSFVIKPEEKLEGNTNYRIVVIEGSLMGGDEVTNTGASATFTTESATSSDIVFTPENRATGVSTVTDIKIKFPEKIYRYGGGAVTTAYLTENIQVKKGTTVVDVIYSVSSDGKTITLTPKETLTPSTTYTVKIASSKFRYENDKVVPSKSISFKTGNNAPESSAFGITLKEPAETSVELVAKAFEDGKLTVKYKNNETGVTKTVITNILLSKGKEKTVEIDGLEPDTTYTVITEFICDDDDKTVKLTQDIRTKELYDKLGIDKILVSDDSDDLYEAVISGNTASVAIQETSTFKVRVDAQYSAAQIKIDGKTVENGKYSAEIEIDSAQKTVAIEITDGTNTKTITLTVSR